MLYELNHCGIIVRDLDASLDFYQDLLGARVVFRKVIEASSTDVVYLQLAGGLIELLHPANPASNEQFGLNHIAFMTHNLDDDYSRLTDAGFEGQLAPRTAGTGVGRLAYVRGPDNARVELIQRDLPLRTAVIEHPIVRSFDHIALVVTDRERARDFYQDLLGMRTLAPGYLHYDHDVLELLESPEPAAASISHIALRVANVDEAVAAFSAHGARIEGAATKNAAARGQRAVIRDPDGVEIVLLDGPGPGAHPKH
jgi:catechol 2,3-dioxygenase-like lactoylglutathione lyase family enzyme